jgi:hypothetical protein
MPEYVVPVSPPVLVLYFFKKFRDSENCSIIINSYNEQTIFIKGDQEMAEFQTPVCDNNHDSIPMDRVWSDGHGNAVYQCLSCGRKMQVCGDPSGTARKK